MKDKELLKHPFITFCKEHKEFKLRGRLFLNFLNEHKALENFMNNIKRDSNMTLYLMPSYYYDIIDLSFTWSNTPQGHDYWKKINKKWRDRAYKIFKRISCI